MASFHFGTHCLTVRQAMALARKEMTPSLDAKATEKIQAAAGWVEEILQSKRTVYGINTGFGILANTAIDPKDADTL